MSAQDPARHLSLDAIPLKPEGGVDIFQAAPGDAAWPLHLLFNIAHFDSDFVSKIGIHDWYEWAGERYVRLA